METDWLKEKANTTINEYTASLKQVIKDPMSVMESIGQGISDTVDEKGIAYVTGTALPSLIRAVWALKVLRDYQN